MKEDTWEDEVVLIDSQYAVIIRICSKVEL